VNSKFKKWIFTIFQKSPLRLKNDLHPRAVQSFNDQNWPKSTIFDHFLIKTDHQILRWSVITAFQPTPSWHYMSKPNSAPPHCRNLFSLHLSEIECLKTPQFLKNHSGPPVADQKTDFWPFLQTAAKAKNKMTKTMTKFTNASRKTKNLSHSTQPPHWQLVHCLPENSHFDQFDQIPQETWDHLKNPQKLRPEPFWPSDPYCRLKQLF